MALEVQMHNGIFIAPHTGKYNFEGEIITLVKGQQITFTYNQVMGMPIPLRTPDVLWQVRMLQSARYTFPLTCNNHLFALVFNLSLFSKGKHFTYRK